MILSMSTHDTYVVWFTSILVWSTYVNTVPFWSFWGLILTPLVRHLEDGSSWSSWSSQWVEYVEHVQCIPINFQCIPMLSWDNSYSSYNLMISYDILWYLMTYEIQIDRHRLEMRWRFGGCIMTRIQKWNNFGTANLIRCWCLSISLWDGEMCNKCAMWCNVNMEFLHGKILQKVQTHQRCGLTNNFVSSVSRWSFGSAKNRRLKVARKVETQAQMRQMSAEKMIADRSYMRDWSCVQRKVYPSTLFFSADFGWIATLQQQMT